MPTYERMVSSNKSDQSSSAPVVQQTLPPPTSQSPPNPNDPMNDYVLKSSLVPCSCPDYSGSCPTHAGSSPSSRYPGDKDSDVTEMKPDQSGMRKSFPNQPGDPQPFLTGFGAFNR
jgi:hypothetical protein